MAATPPVELLELARFDSLEVCRRLSNDQRMTGCVAAVITVYGHFPVSGATRPARRRIYRATTLAQDLRSNRALSPTFLSDVHVEESTELDEIADLLHQPAH